jgi:hypothetical protein
VIQRLAVGGSAAVARCQFMSALLGPDFSFSVIEFATAFFRFSKISNQAAEKPSCRFAKSIEHVLKDSKS